MKVKVPIFIVFTLLAVLGVWFLNSGRTKTAKKETQVTITKPEKEAKNEVRTIEIVARRWIFEPAEIKVKKGERVKLKITSQDVTHGFSLPEFKISEVLMPGKDINVEFVADKTGRFSFFCSVQCGSGHSNMKGILIVE